MKTLIVWLKSWAPQWLVRLFTGQELSLSVVAALASIVRNEVTKAIAEQSKLIADLAEEQKRCAIKVDWLVARDEQRRKLEATRQRRTKKTTKKKGRVRK